jgi:hypothetical protein
MQGWSCWRGQWLVAVFPWDSRPAHTLYVRGMYGRGHEFELSVFGAVV